jgi:hypothetical protein
MAAFGPGEPFGQNRRESPNPYDLTQWLFRGYPKTSGGQRQQRSQELHMSTREAMQLLEHAELVYVRRMTESQDGSEVYWSATRLGLVALASGRAAVRQRIEYRTGL